MKKGIVTLITVLFVFNVFAQRKPDKQRNQKAMQAILQKGRDRLAEQVTSGNHEEASRIYMGLSTLYGEEYVVLYPQEELLLALATRNFDMFIDSALYYNSFVGHKIEAYRFENFHEKIYRYSRVEIMEISNALERSDLTMLEKEVIEIYIHYLFGNDEKKLNKNIRRFKRKYSRKLFHDFFNSLKRATSDNRLNFSIGYSYEGVGAEVNNAYYDYLNFAKLELDGTIKKTYFSFYIGGGFSELTPGVQPLLEDGSLGGQKKASSLKYGFKLGRLLYASTSVQLYPYLSAGGYELSPPSLLLGPGFAAEPSGTVATSLFAGAGLSCDIVLKKWQSRRMFEPGGYFFIRPNFGYDQFISEEVVDRKNNFYISVSFGVSIGSK